MQKKLAVCLFALAVLFGGCAPRQQSAPAPSSQPEEASSAGSDAGEESFTVTWNGSFYTCAGYTEELWHRYARGPQVFIRQATQSTVRVVRKRG